MFDLLLHWQFCMVEVGKSQRFRESDGEAMRKFRVVESGTQIQHATCGWRNREAFFTIFQDEGEAPCVESLMSYRKY